MNKLDILFLFFFVLSLIFILNLILKIVKNVLRPQPQIVSYTTWEKISNYFFITYFITYIINLTT